MICFMIFALLVCLIYHFILNIFDEFIELHGDRNFKDDKSIICGLAKIDNQNFTIIAQQKGMSNFPPSINIRGCP